MPRHLNLGGGAGIDGDRSGMWREMARIIYEVQPGFVFVENSPMLTSRGLGRVLGDLAAMGFDARWGVLGAADIGAKHQRDRIWIVAHAQRKGLEGQSDSGEQEVARSGSGGALAYTKDKGDVWRDWQLGFAQQEHDSGRGSTDGSREWWSVEPNVGRVAHGVACRVDRLKAIGNGQVPLCAATAWRVLNEGWN